MADVTTSNVTIERSWSEGGVTGKDLSCRQVTLVLTAAGGSTSGSQIPASVLQLSVIEQASAFIKSDNTVITVAVPSYTGNLLLFPDAANATATNHSTAFTSTGLTGTFRGVVKGYQV